MEFLQNRHTLNQGSIKQSYSSNDEMEIPSLDDRDNLILELETRVRQLECIHDIFNKVANLNTPFDQILNDIAQTDQIGMILQFQAMKDALRESEQRYRNLIENSLVGIYQANLKCQILYANNVCLQMFGFKTPDQFLAEDFPIPYRNQEDGKTILNILKQTGRIKAVIVSNGNQLQLAEKIDADPVSPKSDSLTEVTSSLEYKGLIEVERDYILRTVQETEWRIEGPRGAAKILEINPSTLRNRMRKMGIKKPGK